MVKHLKKYCLLYYCFLAAGLMLLICSKSSPLYPMNDWVDVNCFYTMGKSLLAGLVPYRDLYEQKGPVLYFVYAILALFNRNSYFFVYLLEVVTFGLFLYYSGKIAALYLKSQVFIYLCVTVAGGLIVLSRAFSHGASVEEMCLFMSAYGLYVALRAFQEERAMRWKEAFTCGIWAGMLLWIKYTMLGLYLGLAMFILLWYPCWQLGWKAFRQTVGGFFAGIGAVSGVVFLYFLAVGALGDLFTVYFYNNIFLYAKEPELSRMDTIWEGIKSTIKWNKIYNLLLIPGFIWAVSLQKKDLRPLVLLCFCFAGLAIGTYWGGWIITYYGLVFAVFSIFGLIGIASLLEWLKVHRLFAWSRIATGLMTLIVLAVMLVFGAQKGRNVYLMGTPKEDMPQYQFAEIIHQTEDPTLLNFGFLDGGFYYAADLVPSAKFFCLLNVNAPDMWQSMYRQISQGIIDYVVTRDRELSTYKMDSSLYEEVARSELYFEGKDRVYYLYRRIGLGE